MKKKLFFIPVIALLMASCSSEEPLGDNSQTPEYAAVTSYLNINIRPSSGIGAMGVNAKASRADVENPYDEGDGTYEDGSAIENNISRVRFYFFNLDGVPFAVRQNVATNQYDNFVDWYPGSSEIGGPNHDETVEKTLNATLGLTFADNNNRPAQVLAVANPTDEILNFTNPTPGENMSVNCMSLDQLKAITANYLPYASNNFVMSNSVYAADGKAVYTTALADNNFQSTPALAAEKENVVTIYIERVLARVDFGVSITPAVLDGVEGTFYKVGSYTINDDSQGGTTQVNEDIYVKFLGWNVTSTTDASRLIKDINPKWKDADIMGTNGPWSTDNYHRSFWALNPEKVQIQYGNFGTAEGTNLGTLTPEGQFANSLKIPASSSFTTTYLQENANPVLPDMAADAPSSPSKVIIAAQLVDKLGKPLTICEWGYNKYTLNGLKNQIAKSLPNLYYQYSENDQTGWSQIDADMITFTTVDPLGSEQGDKEYYVYAVLSEDAPTTWAIRSGDTYTPFSSQGTEQSVTDLVNTYIRGIVNHAMIWNSGLTYYFFDIRHLGNQKEDAGYVGIVRNHLYRTQVTSIKGLGTPVYDPNKEIHPEVTNPEETVIQAKINVLSWRLVSSSYELDWE